MPTGRIHRCHLSLLTLLFPTPMNVRRVPYSRVSLPTASSAWYGTARGKSGQRGQPQSAPSAVHVRLTGAASPICRCQLPRFSTFHPPHCPFLWLSPSPPSCSSRCPCIFLLKFEIHSVLNTSLSAITPGKKGSSDTVRLQTVA